MRAQTTQQLIDKLEDLNQQLIRRENKAQGALIASNYKTAERYCYECTQLVGEAVEIELELRERPDCTRREWSGNMT